MARVVFLCLVFTFILVGLAHGRPKKRSSSSNEKRAEQGLAAIKTQLQNALNENSASAILSVLRSLPTLKGNICSSTSPPPVPPTTQAANTMANEQDFGWLFDLVSTALSQPTMQKMKIVLKSDPNLRRELCGGGQSTQPSAHPTSPSRPSTPPPVAATNPRANTAAVGVSNYVDVALRDEGTSEKRVMPTRPNLPTRSPASGAPATPTHPRATEQTPADASDDNAEYSDEFLSIPAMRKRRSLEMNDVEEAAPQEDGPPVVKKMTSNDHAEEGGSVGPAGQKTMKLDDGLEFQIATVIPPTVIPEDDVQAAVPRVKITGSNFLEDGQFDETITIYPDSYDQAIAMEKKEKEQKKEETLQDQKTLPSNAETSRQQIETTPQQEDETNFEVTRIKKEETKTEDPHSDAENREKKDVQSNDDQLATTVYKRTLLSPNEAMRNEVDELQQEDWEAKKMPEGREIKYEVDGDSAERLAKRKTDNLLKMKLGQLRKKNIFA